MLKEKIREDLKCAMKSGDTLRRDVLRFLENAIVKEEIEKRKREQGLSDEEILAVIVRQVKQRKDSMDQFIQGGRLEMAEKESKESDILKEYLPEQMSEEDVRSLIVETLVHFEDVRPSDFGKVMGSVMQKIQGRFPGEKVRILLQEILK